MIRVFEPSVADTERAYVDAVLQRSQVGPGKVCDEFAELLCQSTGKKHAVLCNSGTTALLLCLRALGVGHGDAVVAPAYGMHAGAEMAAFLGASVWLADVDHVYWNLDPLAIHGWPIGPLERVKAIIAINHNGRCNDPDWAALRVAANGVPIIEDACQSLGCPEAFQLGDLCTLSFSVPKLLTTGQGGAVLSDNLDLITKVRQLADHGGDWRVSGYFPRLGGNWRMPDPLAALGVAQMKRLPAMVQRRQEIHDLYVKHSALFFGGTHCTPYGTGWCVTYETPRARELIEHLKADGIEARQPYKVVSEHNAFHTTRVFPHARVAANTLVYLPGHQKLTDDDVRKVADSILKFEGKP